MKRGLPLIAALLLCSPPAAQADDEELIIIRGRRPESLEGNRAGQSRLIQPTDASRFETLTHLKRETSVLAPESGRISASGFVVPKIRGQDVKLTDVYLEETLLQDPYSGLPLVEDLDLRAFGSMEIHQGVAPVDVPGFNPIGTLRYRFRQEKRSVTRVGTQIGQPYGSSLWASTVHRDEASGLDARVYARQHETSGRYRFYSDEGTPYNSKDDRLRTRENNDQRSAQIVPFFRQNFGDGNLQGMAWVYRAERGLPTSSMRQASTAREGSKGHLANILYSHKFSQLSLLPSVHVGATQSGDIRGIDDPGQSYLGNSEASGMDVHAQRFSLRSSAAAHGMETHLSMEGGQTDIQQKNGSRLAVDLERKTQNSALGLRLQAPEWLLWEGKLAFRKHRDQDSGKASGIVLAGEKVSASRTREARTLSSSAAIGDGAKGLYLQLAEAQRMPSLLEEFGNGSSVRSNPDLKAEAIQHREIGAFLAFDAFRFGTAAYRDRTDHKIIFVPVLANASKALNVRATDISGVDARAEYTWRQTVFYVSTSFLWAYDKTRPQKKRLPAIPEQISVLEVQQSFGPRWILRGLSRYRSDVYRDLANSVALPGAWIHDLHLDHKASLWRPLDTQIGLAIRNVLDLKDVAISAPDTPGSKGRTAYSDIAGAPLPGRQWLLSLAFSL